MAVSLNLFDWNVIGQLAVVFLMLTVLLMFLFLIKEASAQAAHRRNLERMDKERYGRELEMKKEVGDEDRQM